MILTLKGEVSLYLVGRDVWTSEFKQGHLPPFPSQLSLGSAPLSWFGGETGGVRAGADSGKVHPGTCFASRAGFFQYL